VTAFCSLDINRQRLVNQKGTSMIIVTGASGQLGTQVMHELLRRVPANRLVAAVRSPERVSNLAQLGVTIRRCDYDQPETIASVLADAERVLLISSNDFVRSVDQHSAVVDAAQRAGVKLLAYTSLAHADTSTLKAAIPHKYTEPIIRESGVPFTLLRNNLYTEHFASAIRQAAETGILVGSTGDGRIASATRADYAAAAAEVLVSEGHENKLYELSGEVAWSLKDLAAELSGASGKAVDYRQLSRHDHFDLLVTSGLPAPVAEVFVDTYEGISNGQLGEISLDLVRLIGRSSTSLTQTITSVLDADRAGP
jgi:NAD(P)H dehydrogenase (quinone)